MTSKVYVLPDARDRIIRVEGQYSLPDDLTNWVLMEEGEPCDRLNHGQSQYFPDGIYTEDGIPRYKLVDGVAAERDGAEVEADRAALPPSPAPAETDDYATWDALAAAYQEGVEAA